MRICIKCGLGKPVEDFHRNSGLKDGLSAACKGCVKERRQAARPKTSEAENIRNRRTRRVRREANSGLSKRQYHKNRFKKIDALDTLSEDMWWWERLLDRDGMCLACNTLEELTVDHIQSVLKGGEHSWDNVQVLCWPCNKSKETDYVDYRSTKIQLNPEPA